MPWWIRPTLARDIPRDLRLPLLCFWGAHFLGSLLILSLHFAGIRPLEPVSFLMHIFGAFIGAGLLVFWSLLTFSARVGRGGDPPPPISNS